MTAQTAALAVSAPVARLTTALGGGRDIAYGLALQSDGKIVVAGFSDDTGGTPDTAMVRYCTDGSLDDGVNCGGGGFGTGGKVRANLGANDQARSVAVQGDGKLVLAGFTNAAGDDFLVSRFCPNGTLDNGIDRGGGGFASGGSVVVAFGGFDQANAVAIQADGKIVAVGRANSLSSSDFGVVRVLR